MSAHGSAPGGVFAEGLLASSMWTYAATVLCPTQWLRRSGLLPPRKIEGDAPINVPPNGLGRLFSRKHDRPVLLERDSAHSHLVMEFDRMADRYDAFVRPFSTPIFDEALVEMAPYIHADSRVLDAGCGAGRELQRVAALVSRGEVVGIDLAEGMVNAAWADARAHAVSNCAFFQADVADLPDEFTDRFDVVYNSLAHHHYPEPLAAATSVLRVLRSGGVYCVVDPGPAWFNAISAPLSKWGDPGWVRFHSPEEFQALFRAAGFARASWRELLPGFGLAIGQKRAS